MATLIIKNTAHDGYRRTGVAFPRGESRHSADSFTEDQIAALKCDPYLLVTVEADSDVDSALAEPTAATPAVAAADTSPVASEPVAATDEQNPVAATETTSTPVPAAKKTTARASKAKEQ